MKNTVTTGCHQSVSVMAAFHAENIFLSLEVPCALDDVHFNLFAFKWIFVFVDYFHCRIIRQRKSTKMRRIGFLAGLVFIANICHRSDFKVYFMLLVTVAYYYYYCHYFY